MVKTKEEILKMTEEELLAYKWSVDLNLSSHCSNCSNCSDCSYCSDCSNCSHCSNCSYCSDCSDCFGCRNVKVESRYMICNVQFTKEEYELKIKELRND